PVAVLAAGVHARHPPRLLGQPQRQGVAVRAQRRQFTLRRAEWDPPLALADVADLAGLLAPPVQPGAGVAGGVVVDAVGQAHDAVQRRRGVGVRSATLGARTAGRCVAEVLFELADAGVDGEQYGPGFGVPGRGRSGDAVVAHRAAGGVADGL